nr:HAMP domain-containing sensor histidine kinase [Mediterraneibacter glycyrrhizinilyticus]
MLYLFLLLLFLFGTVYFILCFYLWRQHRAINVAENTINNFLEGDTLSRIECSQDGDWYSLFHSINEMASILSAHAENQKQTKEFLQDIISDVSHQIKTPLSALKMYHEIIESHKDDATTVSSFTEKSQREIKRMEDVIYTLLKLARLDAGIIQMEKVPENLTVLMQDVLERFETWAEREHKTITLSGKEDVVISCDALWVSEAIGNIVKNALEHTEDGGHIEVKWSQSPLMTQIEISDDGKGIHSEDLYNIFKRFYRSRYSSDVHGIGLGLPLAKSIVEAHGGTISVTSTLGSGTTFILNFFNLTDK